MAHRTLAEERKRWEGVELFKEHHDRIRAELGLTEKEYIEHLLLLEQNAANRQKNWKRNNG